MLYNIREDWRPIYRTPAGKLTGSEKGNTLLRSKIDFGIRKEFYHKYIESRNTTGTSKVGRSDGPRYTNTGFTIPGENLEALPNRFIRKHVGGNANPSVDKVYWKGRYMPKPGNTANPLIP